MRSSTSFPPITRTAFPDYLQHVDPVNPTLANRRRSYYRLPPILGMQGPPPKCPFLVLQPKTCA